MNQYLRQATDAPPLPREAVETVKLALEIFLAPARLPPADLRDAAIIALRTAQAMLSAQE